MLASCECVSLVLPPVYAGRGDAGLRTALLQHDIISYGRSCRWNALREACRKYLALATEMHTVISFEVSVCPLELQTSRTTMVLISRGDACGQPQCTIKWPTKIVHGIVTRQRNSRSEREGLLGAPARNTWSV